MQYIIYMDESSKNGPHYSNFYGGALVRSIDFEKINASLNSKKIELNLFGEVKWQKVTSNYLTKYIELMNLFFNYIEADLIKLRIMFTHNYHQPINLTSDQRNNEYLLLYYQFFKHAFGLAYSNPESIDISLRLYFDELPVNSANVIAFKKYISGLQNTKEFSTANLKINQEDITEVKSDQHAILQFMDIVLGAMYFRLNNLHKNKSEGENKRGKRTIAKEELYKYINLRIRKVYPRFNIGVSTGITNFEDRWNHPYRHWLFIPTEHRIAPEYVKKK